MATTTKTKPTPDFETAFEQVKELNEQILDSMRKAGTQYLDSYEKVVDHAIDLERKLAGTTKQDWLKSLLDAHADISGELAGAYLAAARGALK